MARDVIETPQGMRREPGRDLADAPPGLRDLLTQLVAREPAALSTIAAEATHDPSLLRTPLTAQLATLLHDMGCVSQLPCREHLERLVDAVLAVVIERLPARAVRFHVADVDSTADAMLADAGEADGDVTGG